MVPFGERYISLRLNSFTRPSSGVMVAHLTPTPTCLIALAASIVIWSLVSSRFSIAEIVVEQLDVEIGMDQLVLDEMPDDAGHLVAVHLDDRVLDLDLRHCGRASCTRTCVRANAGQCLGTALWRDRADPARTNSDKTPDNAQTPTPARRKNDRNCKSTAPREHRLVQDSDLARDQGGLRAPPPRAPQGDARTCPGRMAGAARNRHQRARRARASRAVRARRCALLRRSRRPCRRCLADVARRVATSRDRLRGGRIAGGWTPACRCRVRRRRRAYRHAHDLCAAHGALRARDRVRAGAAQCAAARHESRCQWPFRSRSPSCARRPGP